MKHPMVFQWFPMVAAHWSNDGMVTIHRYKVGVLYTKVEDKNANHEAVIIKY